MTRVLRSVMAAIGVAGCSWDAPPIEWQAPAPVASRVDTAARYTARLELGTGGGTPTVVVATRDSGSTAPGDSSGTVATPSTEVAACAGSWASAAPVRGSRWLAWWKIRTDSSAVLMAEQRDSSGAITQRIIVDSLDRALLGCARPAPAIAVDSINGYVHIGYYMVAPEGPGLFYAHLMDARLQRFETPLAMVYGEKPVHVAVASRGDTVAVVYEDPNSDVGRIAMSVSLTGGHLFEQTARLIPVSTSSQQASVPQIVRLAAGQLWVGWREQSQSGSAFLLRRARIVSR